jgi:two-component system sensor histidine kinase/response regulator
MIDNKVIIDREVTVLGVDDELPNLQILENILILNNYKFVALTDPVEVFEKVIEIKPDLVLLDISMPKLDGFALCRKLKDDKRTEQIPIIFISGRSSTEDIIEGLNAGANDYIIKPFNMTELLARVETQIKLKFSIEKAIEAEQLKALHALMVSQNHELNQLLTAILGQSEIVRMEMNEGRIIEKNINKSLSYIEDACWKMTKIIKKIDNIKKIKFTDYSRETIMLDLDQYTDSQVEE